MSLYADEDLSLAGPSTLPDPSSASGSHVPTDPLQALTAALACPAESAAQAEALIAAGARFEEHPERLPELCVQLLPMVVDGGESLLRAWTLDMVALAVGRSGLKGEIKLAVAQASLEALNRLLAGSSISTIKAVIPIFATIHPILFRLLATSRPPQIIYELFMSSKTRIVSLALDPNARPQNVGIKAAAWKYIQKVMLAGTRAPVADPRLQKQAVVDPNIAMISRDSPLVAMELEEETNLLKTQLITQLFSSDDPAVLHPLFQLIPTLCKSRPTLAPLFVSSITSWTPAALEADHRPEMHIRAVEKTVKMVMGHLVKHPPLLAFTAQLNEAMVRQKQRMEAALVEEQAARKARRDGVSLGKRGMEAESSAQAAKRTKYAITTGALDGRGAEVDVKRYDLSSVIEIVMEALEAVSADDMTTAFTNTRQALEIGNPDVSETLAAGFGIGVVKEAKEEEEDEIINPLDMDMDDEDLLLAQDEEDEEAITFTEFDLPPPEAIDPGERTELANALVERVWMSGQEMAGLADVEVDGRAARLQPREMWMLLLARLATRGEDSRRNAIADFISQDFAARSKLAAIWLNEEWYSSKTASTPSQYPADVMSILRAFLPMIDAKDKQLSPFLAMLPEIPHGVIDMLESLSKDAERAIVGFLALRDLIENRPPIRERALTTLLQLCTFPERKTRVLAISTVRRWVPGSVMSTTIIRFALGVLRRLVTTPADGEDVKMEVEEGEEEDLPVESKYLEAVSKETIPQHVELAFALSRRHQDLLDDIFRIYPKMDEETQASYETMLEPLIQSLGSTPQLLGVLQDLPPSCEKLALRIVQILSAEGSSPPLVAMLKRLISERELDPRFIVPIIGELDKGEIEKQIPRIVGMLGTPETRDVVRTAFASILQKLTPVELLVSLHAEETALKATIEAIGICFSMTTVFRSDVLATAMSRIAEQATLPVVFLRTIIQAVKTYKSLIPFIANNVLNKLVAKKIWTTPQSWEGFVHLAKLIAPASYGVLLQLPVEWLRDVIDRQPALKQGLRGFLASKPQARGQLAEIFGDS